ncbi:MAG: hypothetical protein J5545_05975 [Bacteroidaceae bacterium]|nr:hypothetical protein [Bacteroidaceae bacterium]
MKHHRKTSLLLLLLVVTLLSDWVGSSVGSQLQAIVPGQNLAQVSRYDGWHHLMNVGRERPFGTLLNTPSSFHRLGSSRPARLLPTHGGKPGHSAGRWAKNFSFHPSFFLPLRSTINAQSLSRTVASSPRHYYVIALRRLLC